MVVSADGGIPLYGRAMDGNASDVTVACEFLDHLRSQIADPRSCCFVADSKGWTARTLQPALEHRLRLLSRLPRTTTLCKRLIAQFDRETVMCRLRTYHKKRKHWSWVGYQGSDAEVEFTAVEPVRKKDGTIQLDKDGSALTTPVRRIMPVRTVVCYSSELYHQKTETLGAIAKREQSRCEKLRMKLERRSFACRDDAQEEADRLHEDQPFITLTLSSGVVPQTLVAKRPQRGRPKKNDPKPTVTVRYGLKVQAKAASSTELAERLRTAATYVLVRHRVDGWEISDEEMLDDYARQWRCEHGFSWLKSQAAINPMFVQTPRRIAALCFIYCIALMIHTLIQRNIRRYLHEHAVGLPYRRNKPSPDITARFFYEIFRGMTSQVVSIGGRSEKRIFGDDQWTALGLKAVGASRNAYKPILGRKLGGNDP
jgi:transposase